MNFTCKNQQFQLKTDDEMI